MLEQKQPIVILSDINVGDFGAQCRYYLKNYVKLPQLLLSFQSALDDIRYNSTVTSKVCGCIDFFVEQIRFWYAKQCGFEEDKVQPSHTLTLYRWSTNDDMYCLLFFAGLAHIRQPFRFPEESAWLPGVASEYAKAWLCLKAATDSTDLNDDQMMGRLPDSRLLQPKLPAPAPSYPYPPPPLLPFTTESASINCTTAPIMAKDLRNTSDDTLFSILPPPPPPPMMLPNANIPPPLSEIDVYDFVAHCYHSLKCKELLPLIDLQPKKLIKRLESDKNLSNSIAGIDRLFAQLLRRCYPEKLEGFKLADLLQLVHPPLDYRYHYSFFPNMSHIRSSFAFPDENGVVLPAFSKRNARAWLICDAARLAIPDVDGFGFELRFPDKYFHEAYAEILTKNSGDNNDDDVVFGEVDMDMGEQNSSTTSAPSNATLTSAFTKETLSIEANSANSNTVLPPFSAIDIYDFVRHCYHSLKCKELLSLLNLNPEELVKSLEKDISLSQKILTIDMFFIRQIMDYYPKECVNIKANDILQLVHHPELYCFHLSFFSGLTHLRSSFTFPDDHGIALASFSKQNARAWLILDAARIALISDKAFQSQLRLPHPDMRYLKSDIDIVIQEAIVASRSKLASLNVIPRSKILKLFDIPIDGIETPSTSNAEFSSCSKIPQFFDNSADHFMELSTSNEEVCGIHGNDSINSSISTIKTNTSIPKYSKYGIPKLSEINIFDFAGHCHYYLREHQLLYLLDLPQKELMPILEKNENRINGQIVKCMHFFTQQVQFYYKTEIGKSLVKKPNKAAVVKLIWSVNPDNITHQFSLLFFSEMADIRTSFQHPSGNEGVRLPANWQQKAKAWLILDAMRLITPDNDMYCRLRLPDIRFNQQVSNRVIDKADWAIMKKRKTTTVTNKPLSLSAEISKSRNKLMKLSSNQQITNTTTSADFRTKKSSSSNKATTSTTSTSTSSSKATTGTTSTLSSSTIPKLLELDLDKVKGTSKVKEVNESLKHFSFDISTSSSTIGGSNITVLPEIDIFDQLTNNIPKLSDIDIYDFAAHCHYYLENENLLYLLDLPTTDLLSLLGRSTIDDRICGRIYECIFFFTFQIRHYYRHDFTNLSKKVKCKEIVRLKSKEVDSTTSRYSLVFFSSSGNIRPSFKYPEGDDCGILLPTDWCSTIKANAWLIIDAVRLIASSSNDNDNRRRRRLLRLPDICSEKDRKQLQSYSIDIEKNAAKKKILTHVLDDSSNKLSSTSVKMVLTDKKSANNRKRRRAARDKLKKTTIEYHDAGSVPTSNSTNAGNIPTFNSTFEVSIPTFNSNYSGSIQPFNATFNGSCPTFNSNYSGNFPNSNPTAAPIIPEFSEINIYDYAAHCYYYLTQKDLLYLLNFSTTDLLSLLETNENGIAKRIYECQLFFAFQIRHYYHQRFPMLQKVGNEYEYKQIMTLYSEEVDMTTSRFSLEFFTRFEDCRPSFQFPSNGLGFLLPSSFTPLKAKAWLILQVARLVITDQVCCSLRLPDICSEEEQDRFRNFLITNEKKVRSKKNKRLFVIVDDDDDDSSPSSKKANSSNDIREEPMRIDEQQFPLDDISLNLNQTWWASSELENLVLYSGNLFDAMLPPQQQPQQQQEEINSDLHSKKICKPKELSFWHMRQFLREDLTIKPTFDRVRNRYNQFCRFIDYLWPTFKGLLVKEIAEKSADNVKQFRLQINDQFVIACSESEYFIARQNVINFVYNLPDPVIPLIPLPQMQCTSIIDYIQQLEPIKQFLRSLSLNRQPAASNVSSQQQLVAQQPSIASQQQFPSINSAQQDHYSQAAFMESNSMFPTKEISQFASNLHEDQPEKPLSSLSPHPVTAIRDSPELPQFIPVSDMTLPSLSPPSHQTLNVNQVSLNSFSFRPDTTTCSPGSQSASNILRQPSAFNSNSFRPDMTTCSPWSQSASNSVLQQPSAFNSFSFKPEMTTSNSIMQQQLKPLSFGLQEVGNKNLVDVVASNKESCGKAHSLDTMIDWSKIKSSKQDTQNSSIMSNTSSFSMTPNQAFPVPLASSNPLSSFSSHLVAQSSSQLESSFSAPPISNATQSSFSTSSYPVNFCHEPELSTIMHHHLQPQQLFHESQQFLAGNLSETSSQGTEVSDLLDKLSSLISGESESTSTSSLSLPVVDKASTSCGDKQNVKTLLPAFYNQPVKQFCQRYGPLNSISQFTLNHFAFFAKLVMDECVRLKQLPSDWSNWISANKVELYLNLYKELHQNLAAYSRLINWYDFFTRFHNMFTSKEQLERDALMIVHRFHTSNNDNGICVYFFPNTRDSFSFPASNRPLLARTKQLATFYWFVKLAQSYK